MMGALSGEGVLNANAGNFRSVVDILGKNSMAMGAFGSGEDQAIPK